MRGTESPFTTFPPITQINTYNNPLEKRRFPGVFFVMLIFDFGDDGHILINQSPKKKTNPLLTMNLSYLLYSR